MIILGKTLKMCGVSASGADAVGGETNTTLTISTEILRSASATAARCTNVCPTIKSWSLTGEAIFSRSTFAKFWQWITSSSKTPTLKFQGESEGHTISLTGDVIFTNMRISAGVRDTIRISYSAVGAGKPTIILE